MKTCEGSHDWKDPRAEKLKIKLTGSIATRSPSLSFPRPHILFSAHSVVMVINGCVQHNEGGGSGDGGGGGGVHIQQLIQWKSKELVPYDDRN